MRLHLLALFFFLSGSLPLQTFSQAATSCPNSDFSQGTFENWSGCYGTFSNPCQTQGFQTSGSAPMHSIVTDTAALDSKACNLLHKIYPGETHSSRIGHDAGGGNAAMLKYDIMVSGQPYYLVYRYAVVLNHAGHMPQQSPSFTVEVKDSNGNIVDSIHGYHFYYDPYNTEGWELCSGTVPVIWRNWTTDTVDLSACQNQTVTLSFTSKDCSLGGHFGYAYVIAYCVTPTTKYWTGNQNDQWNNPMNWNPAGVPTSMDMIIIPGSVSTMPVLNISGVSCQQLDIRNGATITIPEGITLTVTGDILIDQP